MSKFIIHRVNCYQTFGNFYIFYIKGLQAQFTKLTWNWGWGSIRLERSFIVHSVLQTIFY